MRALRSCDFCGDDARGTFEVVPDELVDAAGQRRVSLCSHCHDTLETVLEPFLTRHGSDGSGDEEIRPDVTDGRDRTETAGADGTGDVDSDGRRGRSVDAAVDANARAEAIAIGRREASDDPATGVGAGDAPVEHESTDETTDERGATQADEPEQFRKVMRLLSNREFPVDRASFAAVTANAYELEDAHVAEILDHAVARGVVVDDAGTLRRP